MKIYVASSWRNPKQPSVVKALVEAGHEVYDFRNPAPGNNGFRWSDIEPEWKEWTADQFITALDHPIAESGFGLDMDALAGADCTVLVMSCGRSAHLELGWACGYGQLTIAILGDDEPELMYKMCSHLVTTTEEAVQLLSKE